MVAQDPQRQDMARAFRIGVGGWTYPPWRDVFYPRGLRQADELAWASRKLTALEINATYHSLHRPEDFARWAAQTPEGFVFAVKGSRYCTNRRVLAEAGEPIRRFLDQGLAELGGRLGPILWQFMPTKRFDADDFARFLDLLPPALGERPLRHCVEVRHASFADARFADLCRERGVAICLADHPTYPMITERTAQFTYARLMRLEERLDQGYPTDAISAWADRLRASSPAGSDSGPSGGNIFAFFIGAGGEGKIRAPAAAQALLEALGAQPPPALDLPTVRAPTLRSKMGDVAP
jgi:uncharacterized protein YecE (DUF72 family)